MSPAAFTRPCMNPTFRFRSPAFNGLGVGGLRGEHQGRLDAGFYRRHDNAAALDRDDERRLVLRHVS